MLSETEKTRLLARLKRIEGQLGGIRRMVEEDKYCVDILLQISAAQGALGQVGKALLNSHMNTCVSDAFEHGSRSERSNKIAELLDVFSRFGHLGARGA
jgi:CsoR family transcriptional regulator, copper-sensing transcriptional repressor